MTQRIIHRGPVKVPQRGPRREVSPRAAILRSDAIIVGSVDVVDGGRQLAVVEVIAGEPTRAQLAGLTLPELPAGERVVLLLALDRRGALRPRGPARRRRSCDGDRRAPGRENRVERTARALGTATTGATGDRGVRGGRARRPIAAAQRLLAGIAVVSLAVIGCSGGDAGDEWVLVVDEAIVEGAGGRFSEARIDSFLGPERWDVR